LSNARQELKTLQKEYDDVSMSLAEIVNQKGNVLHQLRLPGSCKIPNKTPCGELCKLAFFKDGIFNCRANKGIDARLSRDMFLDNNNQCVMFERKIQ